MSHPLEKLGVTQVYIKDLINEINEHPEMKFRDWNLVLCGLTVTIKNKTILKV